MATAFRFIPPGKDVVHQTILGRVPTTLALRPEPARYGGSGADCCFPR